MRIVESDSVPQIAHGKRHSLLVGDVICKDCRLLTLTDGAIGVMAHQFR